MNIFNKWPNIFRASFGEGEPTFCDFIITKDNENQIVFNENGVIIQTIPNMEDETMEYAILTCINNLNIPIAVESFTDLVTKPWYLRFTVEIYSMENGEFYLFTLLKPLDKSI